MVLYYTSDAPLTLFAAPSTLERATLSQAVPGIVPPMRSASLARVGVLNHAGTAASATLPSKPQLSVADRGSDPTPPSLTGWAMLAVSMALVIGGVLRAILAPKPESQYSALAIAGRPDIPRQQASAFPLSAKSKSPGGRLSNFTDFLDIEGEWDMGKLAKAKACLEKGGLGIIPTDTSYAFVCDVNSRDGVQRIFQIKNVGHEKKPLSLLCKDMSTISKYAELSNPHFQLLKACLPGAYTFILPASREVPKVWLSHKSHAKSWKRKEIGVRIPDDSLCQALLDMLDFPLLCSTVEPDMGIEPYVISDNYSNQLDFIVAAGIRGSDDGEFSSVVDLTRGDPILLRQGTGDTSFCVDPED